MARIRSVVFATLFLFVVASTAWGAAGFKCGTRLVRVGDTTLDVINTCGEPTFREYVGTESRGSFARERLEPDEETGRDVTRGSYGEFSVNVERWYYDCGTNKFIRILTFRGGILRNIRVGRDYGVGASDCMGRASGGSPGEPQKEQAESFGTISILGTPYGAKIYLDQEYMADLPATLEKIEPGAYNLTVRSPGYEDWAKRIVVEANQTAYVNVYLEGRQKEVDDTVPDEAPSEPPSKIYKWTDEEGNIHITDKPPPTQE